MGSSQRGSCEEEKESLVCRGCNNTDVAVKRVHKLQQGKVWELNIPVIALNWSKTCIELKLVFLESCC